MKSPSSCNVSKKRSAAISQRSSEDTAQHSFCYDAIFEGSELRLQLVAPKGAEIVVGWISKTNEHYGTIEEHDVLVAIGTTAVATLQNHRQLKRVTQLIAQTPWPLLITFSQQLRRETVVTPPFVMLTASLSFWLSSSSSSTAARVTKKSRKRSHSSGATVVSPPFRGLHYEDVVIITNAKAASSREIILKMGSFTFLNSFPLDWALTFFSWL